MSHHLKSIKAICKQSQMWELDNPRVVALINNVIKCVENEEGISENQKLTFTNIVLSNLIIFGKNKIY